MKTKDVDVNILDQLKTFVKEKPSVHISQIRGANAFLAIFLTFVNIAVAATYVVTTSNYNSINQFRQEALNSFKNEMHNDVQAIVDEIEAIAPNTRQIDILVLDVNILQSTVETINAKLAVEIERTTQHNTESNRWIDHIENIQEEIKTIQLKLENL